ncbi:MAG: polysaccharide pyruvyl transferase family protein [Nibricoccus sp.]
MNRLTIGVLGVFGAGNLGNEATLTAFLQLLKAGHPDTRIVCICYNTELVEKTYGISTFAVGGGPKLANNSGREAGLLARIKKRLLKNSPVNFVRTLSIVRSCKALVIPGTGVLDDYGTSPGGLPWLLFRWCLAARLCSVPVKYIGVGAGPIVNPRSRRLMGWAARLASYRSYRDQNSKNFAQSIGVNTQSDPVIPDLAFYFTETNSQRQTNRRSAMHIGLGIMSYYGWQCDQAAGAKIFDAYLDKIVCLAHWLLNEGHSLQILIGEFSDQSAVDKFFERLKPNLSAEQRDRIAFSDQQTMDDLLTQIAPLDVVITSRYHNLVAAFCRGVPVISIGYGSKCAALMEDFGLGDLYQDIDTFSVEALRNQFLSATARLESLSDSILSRALQHKALLTQTVEAACCS